MFDGRDVIYLYDGSFEGLMSVVFDCYYNHENPMKIEEENNVQEELFCRYVKVNTDSEKAERVSSAICRKISYAAWRNVYCTYLSDCKGKEKMCLEYIRAGFRAGKNVDLYLAEECVSSVHNAVRRTKNEAHMFIEFVRFSQLEGGVYFGEIEPECNVLPLIGKHFARRFPAMPWIIHDTRRKIALVYNGECYMADTDTLPVLKYSEEEQQYRGLWKQFYDSIEIKERHNEKCRRSHMPKRFWKNLTEMQL